MALSICDFKFLTATDSPMILSNFKSGLLMVKGTLVWGKFSLGVDKGLEIKRPIFKKSIGFNSLAQQSLAVNPLGGFLNAPSDARKFRVIFEIPKEDFNEIQDIYSTNEVDRYWAIIARGCNATLSPRKLINIKK